MLVSKRGSQHFPFSIRSILFIRVYSKEVELIMVHLYLTGKCSQTGYKQ